MNREKDRFISILAHDLRNPLTTILGLSELLSKNLQDYPIEQINEMIGLICDSARKTHILLEDTLQWASTRTQNITFSPSVINLCEVVSEVIDILNPTAKLKKIDLNSRCEENLHINTDVYMLKAILRNLISNSIKFTNPGGKVSISAKKEGSVTKVTVADDGVGINPEILENIFDVSTFHSTTGTANETGTGLGLLLCKEFVEKHSGEIWIDSTFEKGTEVSFTIPG